MLVSTSVTIFALLLLCIFGKLSTTKETKAYLSKWLIYILTVSVVAGAIFGCLYLKTKPTNSLVSRLDTIFVPTYENNITRILMWKQTLELAQDNPICGVGAGNWKISFLSYGVGHFPGYGEFNELFYVRPENDYLWTLSEIGIFGFGFYLSIFGIIFWYIFKILNSQTDANNKLLSVLMFFGFVGYMAFSCFTFPKERIFHSMFLLLMMAVVISIYNRSFGKQGDISRLLMFVLAIPCLCLLLLAIYIGYARLSAEIHTKRALAARKAKAWPDVISEIDNGYSVFATLDPMSTPLKWYRGEANFLLNNIPEAFEDFKAAYKAHPYHIHVLNNLATCYEITDNHNLAINYYNKALEVKPQFQDALINLGAAYYNAGRYEESHETLLRCSRNKQTPRLQQYLKAVEKKLDK
jgi:tetratricopeptide (TPR) repeat protein